MLRRLLPAVSKLRSLPGLLPKVLRPVLRISTGRKLILAGLLTATVAAAAWWWTGEWQAAALSVGLALTILIAVLAVELLARRLSRAHARAWELQESKASSIQEQRESWVEQVRQLRQMGVDPSAVPVYLLIGESGGGKTSSLKHAELNYSFGREPVVGDGGTRNCLLHFTNDAWVIDTAGRYVISGQLDESGDEDLGRQVDEAEWLSFLGRLRRFRPRAPINGVVVSIPADALMDDDADARLRKAMLLRKALNELRVRLEMTFPVTVMITKADRLGGFSEFFDGMREWRDRRQLLGWSPDRESSTFAAEPFRAGFDDLLSGFRKRCIDIAEAAGPDASPDRLRRIHSFPEEFAGIEEALESYLATMLAPDRYFGTLRFRGFFLTSSLQEGAPAFRACEELLGRSIDEFGFTGKRERSLFVHDFYAEKVFREAGMVAATSRRKRRATLVNRVGLAATIAVLATGGLLMLRNHRDTVAGIHPETEEALGNDPGTSPALLTVVDQVRAIPPSSDPDRDAPRPERIAAIRALGDAIERIERGDLAGLDWFDVLSRGKHREMLAELRRLHADRTTALVFGGMPAGIVDEANGGGLCDPGRRPKLLEALVVVAAANYGSEAPLPVDLESALEIAFPGLSDERRSELAAEYERVRDGAADVLRDAMEPSIGRDAVTLVANEVGSWHPVGVECDWSFGDAEVFADLWRRVRAAEEAWKALETDTWQTEFNVSRDRLDAFYATVEKIRNAVANVDRERIDEIRTAARQEIAIGGRLRDAAGATADRPVTSIDMLAKEIEGSQAEAVPGLLSTADGDSTWLRMLGEWVSLQSGTSTLSPLAEDRVRALEALEELRKLVDGEDLLATPLAGDEHGRIDLGESFMFAGALGDFERRLEGLFGSAEAANLGQVAQKLRLQVYENTVKSTRDAILAALESPDAMKDDRPLGRWRGLDPLARIASIAVPFAGSIGEWRSNGLVELDFANETIDEVDGAAVVMIERFLADARIAIEVPEENRHLLDPARWVDLGGASSSRPPTVSQIVQVLQQVLEDYDECLAPLGGDESPLGHRVAEDAGLDDVQAEVDRLLPLRAQRDEERSLGEDVEALVELADELREVPGADASWREWLVWWDTWADEKSLFLRLRVVEDEPTIEKPRSIVDDRIRQLAGAFEDRLRQVLGGQTRRELEALSGKAPAMFIFDGDGDRVEVEQVHEWFAALDAFEKQFGRAVPGSDEALQERVGAGTPIATIDSSGREWLDGVRAWRAFLYGSDGAPSGERFAARRVEIALDADDEWSFDTYLNLRLGDEVLRFNAQRRALELEDALQVERLGTGSAARPGGTPNVHDEGPLALLAWLHGGDRARDGRFSLAMGEASIPIDVDFADSELPAAIPGRLPTESLASGRR
jgi:hypothetical protein